MFQVCGTSINLTHVNHVKNRVFTAMFYMELTDIVERTIFRAVTVLFLVRLGNRPITESVTGIGATWG